MNPRTEMGRRDFLEIGAGIVVATGIASQWAGAEEKATMNTFPLCDLHVHLDNSTIDATLDIAAQRNVKFGIVEHAGTKENVYPTVLSDDAELRAYVSMLNGKPVYKGIQAEWTDWTGCFSREALSELDFVLSDAMTFPDKNGKRMKLWEKSAAIGDPAYFMDRYVDWHVDILSKQPLDIFANVSWLPPALAADYDLWWTDGRIQKVVDAAVKNGVAIEISSSFLLPKMSFLKAAKSAGAKFTFGSNGRYPNMGKLEYSVQMARQLGLTRSDMFVPAPNGQKAIQRWRPKA